MLITIPQILQPAELIRLRHLLDHARWVEGSITAGTQSVQEKRNRQLPEEAHEAGECRRIVLEALSRSGLFFTATLPHKIYPPLFNRYEQGMDFGAHIDNAVRTFAATGQHVRTDVSATLFLSPRDSYQGGELVVQDTYGTHEIKLDAGDVVLYPGTSVHQVRPVTRGVRMASFFWIQSMVRDDAERTLLFDMDGAISALRAAHGDSTPVISLTGAYHNLIRRWADV